MYEFRSNEGGVACEETPEMRLKIEAGMCVCVLCVYLCISLDASVTFFFYFLLPVIFSLHLIVCLLNFVCHYSMIVCLSNLFVCLCTTEVTGVHSWCYRCTLLMLWVYTADVTGAPCWYYQY